MILWLPGEPRDLTLLPMAARRALDRAGLKLSLSAWQGLDLEARRALAEAGSAAEVDGAEVARLAAGADSIAASEDPCPEAPPVAVRAIVAIDEPTWRALDVVARHALAMYAGRGRAERVAELYERLTSSGVSQSSR